MNWVCVIKDKKWHHLEDRFIPVSHHFFKMKHCKQIVIGKSERKGSQKRQMKSKKKAEDIAIWYSYGAHKFYGKLYCGRFSSCGERKAESSFRLVFMLFKKEIYAFFKILFDLKCAFLPSSHFDFNRLDRCFCFSSLSLLNSFWDWRQSYVGNLEFCEGKFIHEL